MPERVTDYVTHDLYGLMPLIVTHGIAVLGALVILGVGLWLSGKAHLWAVRALGRAPHMDQMLVGFFGGMIRYLILTVTVLAVLSQFGIQTTSFIAVLGAAGLAIGLALQGTLSNLAAGVMLLIVRPFRIGHSVQVSGIQGTVKELSLFWTELVTGDNVQIIVPNGSIWGQPLRNFSHYPERGFEVRFKLAAGQDLNRAVAAATESVAGDDRINTAPKPSISLDHNAADNAVEVVISGRTATGNIGAVRTDLIRTVRAKLEASADDAGTGATPASDRD